MNPKIFLTVTIAACLLAACKKNTSNGPTGATNKLKLYVEDARATPYNSIDTFNITYDISDRMTSMRSSKLNFVYTYSGNTGFGLDLFEQGVLSIHENGFIKGSFVDSTFQYNNTHDTTTQKFVYNGSQLTSQITYDYSHSGSTVSQRETYTYDGNGDLSKTVETDGGGHVNTITTYTYTDKPLQFSVSPSYYPLQSKHLPATQKQTDGLGNTIANVTYTYVFDDKGRVIKETNALSSGVFVVKSYIYY